MFGVQCVARTVFVALTPMSLLTELGWSKGGLCYKHGAPNGALPPKAAAHSTENSEEPALKIPSTPIVPP